MGSIHGPRRTCLTWSQALNQSEEGDDEEAELTGVVDGAEGASPSGRGAALGSGKAL
jgi:hypothetical protein